MNLRTTTGADLETILRHRREMFLEMGLDASPRADVLSARFFEKAIDEATYHGWLFEEQGRIAAGGGVVLIEYHPSPNNPCERRPWVVNMYTEPEWRRRGLARRLMETMIQWTRAAGYPNLFLHASDAGRPLYETLGFMPANEMRLKL